MQKLRFMAALIIGRLAVFCISLVARGRGTNLPGALSLKIDPRFLSHFRGLDLDKTIIVTGTNGKSTTTNLLAHVLQSAGLKTAANLEGANLPSGLAVTLIKNSDWRGRLQSEYLLLEADERFLPLLHQQLPARRLCVTNIQKDQVQRNGEPDIIYRKLASVIDENSILYLNNEEPNCLSLAKLSGRAVLYGVEPHAASFTKQGDPYAVTMPCPICASGLKFRAYNIDNIGPFYCPHCGFASSEQPDYAARQVDFAQGRFTVKDEIYPFRYTTPYFLYCYLAGLAVAHDLGLSAEQIRRGFAGFTNIGGRMEDIRLGGKTIRYLRMKQENPETVQSAINIIAADGKPKIFLLGLDELVDFHPHYTNTFYAWDCDFRALVESDVSRFICFSGTVAYDAALRLIYDGAPREKISVLPSNDNAVIAAELAKYAGENVYLITWLKKYQSLAEYARQHAEEGVYAKA